MGLDGWLSFTAVTPRALLQSDANNCINIFFPAPSFPENGIKWEWAPFALVCVHYTHVAGTTGIPGTQVQLVHIPGVRNFSYSKPKPKTDAG